MGSDQWFQRDDRIKNQFNRTEAQDLARSNHRFLDGFAIDKRAITRAQISNDRFVRSQQEFAMSFGNSGVINLKIVSFSSAQSVQALIEAYLMALSVLRFNSKAWHMMSDVGAVKSMRQLQ